MASNRFVNGEDFKVPGLPASASVKRRRVDEMLPVHQSGWKSLSYPAWEESELLAAPSEQIWQGSSSWKNSTFGNGIPQGYVFNSQRLDHEPDSHLSSINLCDAMIGCDDPECEGVTPCTEDHPICGSECAVDPCAAPCADEDCLDMCYDDDCHLPVCIGECAQDICSLADSHCAQMVHDCHATGCVNPANLETSASTICSQRYAQACFTHDATHHLYQQKYHDSSTLRSGFDDSRCHTAPSNHGKQPYCNQYDRSENLDNYSKSSCNTGVDINDDQDIYVDTPPYSPELGQSAWSTPRSETSIIMLANQPTYCTPKRPRKNENVCCWITDEASNSICGATYTTTKALQNHVEEAHVNDLSRLQLEKTGYYCQWESCNRYKTDCFAARPKLKRHIQIHTNYKPFSCSWQGCETEMKTKDAMVKHERIHTGDRPYPCTHEGCSSSFITSSELVTHLKVHSGEKPHACNLCDERFADSSNLSKHKKTHFIGRFRCPDCNVRMKRWDQMRRHITSQNHAQYLLMSREHTAEYKAEMDREWHAIPESERALTPCISRSRSNSIRSLV